MMLMMVVAMVMAMEKIFAFRFYISKLPINRLRGRYVKSKAQRGPGIGRGPPLQYAAQLRGMREGRRIPLNFCFCNSCGNCSTPDFPRTQF